MNIGSFVLPHGVESACGILNNIYQHLDARSLINIKQSSIIKQLNKIYQSNDFERTRNIALKAEYNGVRSINETILTHAEKRLYDLTERYKKEFPRGTPFICACEHRRINDIKSFVNLHTFQKYKTTLKDMVSQVGKTSNGHKSTPLIIATMREDLQVVHYLIEQGADPNIADDCGLNALHCAAWKNKTNTDLIQLLLNHMTLDNINRDFFGTTPLDVAYRSNNSPIRQEIIALLRSKGAKANHY